MWVTRQMRRNNNAITVHVMYMYIYEASYIYINMYTCNKFGGKLCNPGNTRNSVFLCKSAEYILNRK